MNWNEAIAIMATPRSERDDVAELDAIREIALIIVDLCTDDVSGLYDWIAAGDYSGNETPKSLAAEWNRTQEDTMDIKIYQAEPDDPDWRDIDRMRDAVLGHEPEEEEETP